MVVRPLNGLVSIAEYPTRFGADTAVAKLTAAGIDAAVLADPAAGVAPHLVTSRSFSVLVRVAVADDANLVLVRSGAAVGPPGIAAPSTPAVSPGDGAGDEGDEGRLERPRWVKVVAWTTAGSLVLPLVLAAARTLSQL